MTNGYYLVSRNLNDPLHDLHPHSRGEPACSAFAWVDLIGLARWKDAGGCPRGSLNASERFLATRWNWHRSRVRRFLSDLESENRISRDPQTGRRQARITICNYDTYQDPRPTGATESDPRVGPRVGPNRKKKEERRETDTSDFEAVWTVSRRGSKKKALAQYRKAVPDKIEHDGLLDAWESMVSHASDERFIPHLWRWIRDERWVEDLPATNGNGNGKKEVPGWERLS